jgi:hypothetical protein
MNSEMMLHHMAIVDDLKKKRASLQEQLKSLEQVERYHLHEIEMYKMFCEPPCGEPGEPIVSPASQLFGKTMAEACEAALRVNGAPARALEIAEILAAAFNYGDGGRNRSYVNALYNAMARKPGLFQNNDGIWTIRRPKPVPKPAPGTFGLVPSPLQRPR